MCNINFWAEAVKKKNYLTICWWIEVLIKSAHNLSLFLESEIYKAILPLSQIDIIFPIENSSGHSYKRGRVNTDFLCMSLWTNGNCSLSFGEVPENFVYLHGECSQQIMHCT